MLYQDLSDLVTFDQRCETSDPYIKVRIFPAQIANALKWTNAEIEEDHWECSGKRKGKISRSSKR